MQNLANGNYCWRLGSTVRPEESQQPGYVVSIDMRGYYDTEYLTAGRKSFQIVFDVSLKSIGVPAVNQHGEWAVRRLQKECIAILCRVAPYLNHTIFDGQLLRRTPRR
jgi:hypothetical protein